MKTSFVLVSQSYDRLAALCLRLAGTMHDVTSVQSRDPVAEASACPVRPSVMLVELTGRENVVALRGLLEGLEGTRIVFTVPEIPPSAAMARLVRTHRGSILPREESVVIMTATLISMAAQGAMTGTNA